MSLYLLGLDPGRRDALRLGSRHVDVPAIADVVPAARVTLKCADFARELRAPPLRYPR
jgi:hypothetical protein